MIYRVVLHKAAVSEIEKLPSGTKKRIIQIIDKLSTEPVPLAAQRLKGRKSAYRIRVSDYRLLYEVHATEVVVYIIGVGHRKEVYRRLIRRK